MTLSFTWDFVEVGAVGWRPRKLSSWAVGTWTLSQCIAHPAFAPSSGFSQQPAEFITECTPGYGEGTPHIR